MQIVLDFDKLRRYIPIGADGVFSVDRPCTSFLLVQIKCVFGMYLSKWFCDTSTDAVLAAACYGSFITESFGLSVVSYG
jgi:hypothetical protein